MGEGGETISTHSSGPDDTDNGGCERDWGFETHSRRTFTRLTHSEASESALGEVDDTRQQTPSTTTTTATVKWQVGEHFHFHTTRLKGFSSTEALHLEVSWNLFDRRRRPPEDEEWCWSGSFP